jgi:hypothetical protein
LRDWLGKRISITQKNTIQKLTIKRIKIKIETQNKFYFWLNGEIEKKINWAKEQKKWWSKLKKKIKQFFYRRVKRTTNLTKCPENKKNKDQMKQNSISQIEIEWCN